MRPTHTFALLLTLLPSVAKAQDFAGDYALESCGASVDGAIRVTAGTAGVAFFEASCTLRRLSELPGMGEAAIYDMSCQGEGEGWVDRTILMRGWDGGLIMLREGFVQEFVPC